MVNHETAIKVGLRFEHARYINADKTPMIFRVTRIARGVVYYRAEIADLDTFHKNTGSYTSGSPFKESIERFPDRVGRILGAK